MIKFKNEILYDILTNSFQEDVFGFYYAKIDDKDITLFHDPTSPLNYEYKVYVNAKYVFNVCGTFVNVNTLYYNFESNIAVLNVLANCVYLKLFLDEYVIVSHMGTGFESYEMFVRNNCVTLKHIPDNVTCCLFDCQRYIEL